MIKIDIVPADNETVDTCKDLKIFGEHVSCYDVGVVAIPRVGEIILSNGYSLIVKAVIHNITIEKVVVMVSYM